MEFLNQKSKDNYAMESIFKTLNCFSLFILFAIALALPMKAVGGDQGTTQPTLVLTLDKALTMALEQNRDVLIAGQDREKAGAQVAEARSGAFPQISLSSGYTRNIKKSVMFIPANTPMLNPTNSTQTIVIGSDHVFQAGITLNQPLFDRKVGVALDIANTYEDFSEEGLQVTKQAVVLEVKRAFYGVMLAQKLVVANREGLDVVKQNYDNVRSQFNHGAAAEYDLLRAEVEVANTEPLLISAENNLALAKNSLKNLLAVPLEQEISIDGEFRFEEISDPVLENARQNALSANPTIRQLALQESLYDKNISVEKSNYFPSLDLTGSYQWQTQDNTLEFSKYNWAKTLNVGLQLSYTIFDGFRTHARAQEAEIDRERVRYTRLKMEEGLKIQIQSGELKMAEAKKKILGQGKNVEEAQKAVRIAQSRFKSGLGTQLELLDTQVAMTRAQTNYAMSLYDYLVAKAEWEHAVGSTN
jgi:outer membrane protein